MSASKVREIEQAIRTLSPAELRELRAWFEAYTSDGEDPLDARIAEDLAAGRLDRAAARAFEGDHENQG